MPMLTRSRAKAERRPVFVDDKWNDQFIASKDEQIDRKFQEDPALGWDSLREEDSDEDSDSDEDGWHSGPDSSDDEDEDDGEEDEEDASMLGRWVAGGSWTQNALWTLATVSAAPVLLYAAVQHHRIKSTPTTILTLPERRVRQRWPLQSASFPAFLTKVLLNVVTLAGLAAAAYFAACNATVDVAKNPEELLDWRRVQWTALELKSPEQCSAGVFPVCWANLSTFSPLITVEIPQTVDEAWLLWSQVVAAVSSGTALVLGSDQCIAAIQQAAAIAVAAVVALAVFHRAATKLIVVVVLIAYVAANVTTEWKREQQARVQISAVDPAFAFVNESIFIAIDGQNLEQGGTIAWAPYWGGLYQSAGRPQQSADECPKLFPQLLRNGGVLVTFDQVNEYVPCYQSAAATAASVVVDGELRPPRALQCFEDIRLRVKDHKSVPGWSLGERQGEPEHAEL